jgi:hypothetical protein
VHSMMQTELYGGSDLHFDQGGEQDLSNELRDVGAGDVVGLEEGGGASPFITALPASIAAAHVGPSVHKTRQQCLAATF